MTAQKRKPLTMTFDAQLVDVKGKAAKPDLYSSQLKGGGLDLLIHLDYPQPPKEPHKGWPLQAKRPELPARKKDESDEDYATRSAPKQRELADYASAERRYQDELSRYERSKGSYQQRVVSYAQIGGFALVAAGKPVKITISPADTDLLPGFEATLLDEPDDDPVTALPAGADDLDEPDEGDG